MKKKLNLFFTIFLVPDNLKEIGSETWVNAPRHESGLSDSFYVVKYGRANLSSIDINDISFLEKNFKGFDVCIRSEGVLVPSKNEATIPSKSN